MLDILNQYFLMDIVQLIIVQQLLLFIFLSSTMQSKRILIRYAALQQFEFYKFQFYGKIQTLVRTFRRLKE